VLGATRPAAGSSVLPRLGPVAAVWHRSDPVAPPRAGKSPGEDYAESRGLGRIAGQASITTTGRYLHARPKESSSKFLSL
jgi:hypothetical protein